VPEEQEEWSSVEMTVKEMKMGAVRLHDENEIFAGQK